jgi:anti-sigma factor RsiW
MGSHDDSPELAELSALADGSLDPARREQVRARIAASPELNGLYERERAVVALLHEARSRDRAPAALRERIDRAASQHATARRAAWRPSPVNRLLAGLLATAAVVVALVLILPAGTPGSPSVSQAAALGNRAITSGVPGADPDQPGKLGTKIQNLYFPDWFTQDGWKAVGERRDHINGRPATTVFYVKNGIRIAYTIVGSPALKTPSGGTWPAKGYQSLTLDGRQVVTWHAANKTCVLSAASSNVPAPGLLTLARQN